MPDTIDAARKLITERLSAIEAEAGKLKRALEELGERDGAAPASAKPRRKRTAGKRRRRSQAPRGQRREQLLAAIAAKPGARPSELAAEIGIAPGQVSTLLAKARAEKLIVKKGAGYALAK
jgi:predicted Rossmann fold nucleotide-binding protein DprA/Smf involved in DNA uptake